MSTRIDPIVETRVVAYLARGETFENIKRLIKETTDKTIANPSIVKIKQRNAENLNILRTKVMDIEEANALDLKGMANKILKSKLGNAEKEAELKAKLHDDYLEGVIDAKEYAETLKRIGNVSIPELVVVSKEMHQQSKKDDGVAPQANKNLQALADAIKNGDELVLNQMIFNPKKDDSAPPVV